MPTIEDILQIRYSNNLLKQSSQKIIPITLNAVIDLRIGKLNKITEDVGTKTLTITNKNSIPQVFHKFKSSLLIEPKKFELRELKTLSWSLNYAEKNIDCIFNNTEEIKKVFNFLENNWKDSFLVGLIDTFLKNWDTSYRSSLEVLEHLIHEKLKKYNGSRNSILSFKNNINFFNIKNGDLIFGDTIAKQNIPILKATETLGVPPSWITYPYFSKVITTYYERKKEKIEDYIDDLNNVLDVHNSSNTNKRLISKIILQANTSRYSLLQDKLKYIAFNKIGDPNNNSKWLPFENATQGEQYDIRSAKNTLNEWITREFINVFFNVCINDDRRKNFWLKYVSKISSFKVYGPAITKNILKRDDKISDYVDDRFEPVYSNKDVSAFILFIGNYMIIEFSNEGYACCAYKMNSENKPTLDRRIHSVDDLRNSGLPLAIQSDSNYYYVSDEGRLLHNNNWEAKFNHWLNAKVIV